MIYLTASVWTSEYELPPRNMILHLLIPYTEPIPRTSGPPKFRNFTYLLYHALLIAFRLMQIAKIICCSETVFIAVMTGVWSAISQQQLHFLLCLSSCRMSGNETLKGCCFRFIWICVIRLVVTCWWYMSVLFYYLHVYPLLHIIKAWHCFCFQVMLLIMSLMTLSDYALE